MCSEVFGVFLKKHIKILLQHENRQSLLLRTQQ